MLFVEFRFLWFFLAVFAVYWSLAPKRFSKNLAADLQLCFLRGLELEICLPPHGVDRRSTTSSAGSWRGAKRPARARLVDRQSGRESRHARVLQVLQLFRHLGGGACSTWLGLPANLHTLNIIIPVGVSFYTFHSMSYTIDVYRGKMRAVRVCSMSPASSGSFPRWWPVRSSAPSAFLPQLQSLRKFSDVDVRGALILFLTGFIKKACIADAFAPFG